jgi:hypothetical protein
MLTDDFNPTEFFDSGSLDAYRRHMVELVTGRRAG